MGKAAGTPEQAENQLGLGLLLRRPSSGQCHQGACSQQGPQPSGERPGPAHIQASPAVALLLAFGLRPVWLSVSETKGTSQGLKIRHPRPGDAFYLPAWSYPRPLGGVQSRNHLEGGAGAKKPSRDGGGS